MIPKPIDQITYDDLVALVANQVPESRTLEFKRELPSESKEFLRDVSALANTNGGDIIFGVDEAEGVASALPGLAGANEDDTVLRLESIARDGLDPRISGLRHTWLKNAEGVGFLVMRVPASFAAPHRVECGDSRFYGRDSKGKYLMDTHQLRLAFTATEGLPARMRTLHDAARANATGVRFPFRMSRRGPYVVLSVVPLSYFREKISLPVDWDSAVRPARGGGADFRRTLDGIICHCPMAADNTTDAYPIPSVGLSHWLETSSPITRRWCPGLQPARRCSASGHRPVYLNLQPGP
jgi:hypothetical protein